ncbi:hypothetical protein SAMN02910276_03143 [Butyrivibrio sp. Su6]|nr:hypothetical protein SAMN02910276_03143 [Butyrivibrio sp. Su6]
MHSMRELKFLVNLALPLMNEFSNGEIQIHIFFLKEDYDEKEVTCNIT